jgi:predicted component of type VI protein secretion system
LGSDAAGADAVLTEPSIAPRHARIVRMPDGGVWIFDLGSTAGTWVNYDEIPREGRALREGDRVNLGRAAFRIRLAGNPAERGEA